MLRARLRYAIVWTSILALIATGQPAKADPFEDFFRALRRALNEPQRKASARRKRMRKRDESKSLDTSGKVANTPPSSGNTRTTTRAGGPQIAKSDYPYGTPVPGKKGFVTSPFAPESGYIDVRDFPPGTPVKDPYTNKVFLTP